MNFLVIGERCKDVFVYGEVVRLSPEAPIPVFKPTRKVENGGMAENVFNNLFQLIEKKATLVGHFCHTLITKTRYVEDKSNHYFIRVDENDKSEPIELTNKLTKLINDADCIIISDYDKGFISLSDIYLICQAKKNKAVIFLDTKKKLTPVIFDQVDFIKFNQDEYQRNSFIAEDFKDKIILTKGGDGAHYDGHDFPAIKKTTSDVSGAGDTFLAALAFYYMDKKDIKHAIQKANEAASKVVSQRGVTTL